MSVKLKLAMATVMKMVARSRIGVRRKITRRRQRASGNKTITVTVMKIARGMATILLSILACVHYEITLPVPSRGCDVPVARD